MILFIISARINFDTVQMKCDFERIYYEIDVYEYEKATKERGMVLANAKEILGGSPQAVQIINRCNLFHNLTKKWNST